MSDWLELKPCVPGGAQRLRYEPVPTSLENFEKAIFILKKKKISSAYHIFLFP